MNLFTTADYLNRNGIIAERARREGRSLSYEERQIIAGGRNMAASKNMVRHQLNGMEMAGERDWDQVLAPIKVVAVFAYYNDPFEDIPATASYFIRSSNHPSLPTHGNVGGEQLEAAGIKLPKTPSYEDWVECGRKVVGH